MSAQPALRIAAPEFVSEPPLSLVLDALPEARIAGGAVRDILAGRPVADVDLATPRTPDEVVEALRAAGIRAVPTGLDHGTITAVVDGRGFEITTLRRDVETDGRRAVVAFTDDWREDAARRDFTINAMFMTRDGAVYDYFGGIADLRVGVVRFVGEPARRIAEDYLRVLRFFRFYARYGRTAPDDTALAAIRAAVPYLSKLSAERVWNELTRILAAPDPREAIRLMDSLGVLDAVMLEGCDRGRFERVVANGAPVEPLLRAAALLTGDVDAFADRLRLANAERERLRLLASGPAPGLATSDDELRRLLADLAPEVLIDRTWLHGGAGADWSALRARIAAIPPPRFPLEGRDVLAVGVAPGPEVGRLLRAVREWWLQGGCHADAAACRAELARLLSSPTSPQPSPPLGGGEGGAHA